MNFWRLWIGVIAAVAGILSVPRIARRMAGAVMAAILVYGGLDSARAATGFMYQGRLVDGASLANGNYELGFRLFDSLSGGAAVGPELNQASVAVSQGLFTVELDFGAAAFNGSERWLQISARPVGSVDPAEVLVPRQPIAVVPYALRSFAGSGNAAELISGILPDARLSAGIARTLDLTSTSNALTAQLTQLAASVTSLTSSLVSLSNRVATLEGNAGASLPAGVVMVSIDPADPGLIGMGLSRFTSVEAPGWSNGSTANAPAARFGHGAVWTGSQLIVWGGTLNGGAVSGVGAIYDPALNLWSPLSTLDDPTARSGHTAVWTGESMLVWGGVGAGVSVGGRYVAGTLTWLPIPALDTPDLREGHVAVWTGARMLVWGGSDPGGLRSDGGLYDPIAQAWTGTPVANAPLARMGATAIWTGTHLVVWGGLGESGQLASGAVLPVAGGITPGVWSATSGASAPSARTGHTAVWTGQRMIVWGGINGDTRLGDGASYDPQSNVWTPLPALGAPTARAGHHAVWTGEEMLIFGGEGAGGAVASGAAFNPTTGLWRTLSSNGSPLARSEGTGHWTGTEFLIFGGRAGGTPLAALQRLNPQPTWYFYRKP